MARNPDRIEERVIGRAVVSILAGEPNGRATVATIRGKLQEYVRLSMSDHDDSPSRALEEVWEQQVRNLKSHHDREGNVFREGYVRWVRRGVWELTEEGWAYFRSF